MKPLTKEWIKKAEEDHLVMVRESKETPLVASAICFHAQQCVEKEVIIIFVLGGS